MATFFAEILEKIERLLLYFCIEYYLEDVVELLDFVPSPSEKKRKKEKEETQFAEEDAAKEVSI